MDTLFAVFTGFLGATVGEIIERQVSKRIQSRWLSYVVTLLLTIIVIGVPVWCFRLLLGKKQ